MRTMKIKRKGIDKRKNKSYKTKLIMSGFLVCLLFIFVSCRQKNVSEEQDLFKVTFLHENFSFSTEKQGNEWLQTLEDKTGIKTEIELFPTLVYVDKIKSLIASDKLPMVFAANNSVLESSLFNTTLKAGNYWPLDEYLKDYPNLYAYVGEAVWESSRMYNKIYGIPRLRIFPRNGAYYRADWAESLGIEPPNTMEELYHMLYAFTYDDPDGNGVNDTYGIDTCWNMWGNRGWNGIQTLTTAIGGPNGWAFKDGKMEPDFITDEYIKVLDYFKKLYKDGILAPDFIFITATQRLNVLKAGKVGMIFGVIDDIAGIEKELKEQVDTGELAILPPIREKGEEPRINSTTGYNGIVMFNKQGKNGIHTEADLRKILSFFDWLCTTEGLDLIEFGVEGVHYTVDEQGKKIMSINDEGKKKIDEDRRDFDQIVPLRIYGAMGDGESSKLDIMNAVNDRMNYLVFDDSKSLVSETYQEYADELNNIIREAGLKYIIGEIDEEGYRLAYQHWLDEGGSQVIKEYTTQYIKQHSGK